MNDAETIIAEAIEAHGGASHWKSLEALDVELSASGFLFTAKRRPILKHARARAYAHEPRFTFLDFPRVGRIGQLIGDEEVTIRDNDNRMIARRLQPRSAFGGFRRQFSWDDLDFLYFGGYATWNYLAGPFLFLQPGFRFEKLPALQGDHESWARVLVTFPPDIPTHSRTQLWYFDTDRYLTRLDYTATVVGRWAHAAHLCHDYREFGGIKAPTRRQARPLFWGNNPLPWPILVALEIHDIVPVPLRHASTVR